MIRPAMRPAASVIVLTEDGRIVGITRGLDVRDIALPGGRAEGFDASLAHTAARELREETGVEVDPEVLQPVLRNGLHMTFYAPEVASWPSHLASRPFEGFASVWPPEAFLGADCTYAESHTMAFQRVGIL